MNFCEYIIFVWFRQAYQWYHQTIESIQAHSSYPVASSLFLVGQSSRSCGPGSGHSLPEPYLVVGEERSRLWMRLCFAQSGSWSYHELIAPTNCFQTLPSQGVVSTMSLWFDQYENAKDLQIALDLHITILQA